MNMKQLKELSFLLQELISYEKYIKNAHEIARKAVPKGPVKNRDDSFNYILEVHLGDDIRKKFVRARYLEDKLYKNSKKYSPQIDKGIGAALIQASSIYEGYLKKQNDLKKEQ